MENTGAGFINPMLAKCKEFGIKIQLRTIVDDLIVNDKGCVVGVKARVNHRFNRPESGKVVYIRATKGVLLLPAASARTSRCAPVMIRA